MANNHTKHEKTRIGGNGYIYSSISEHEFSLYLTLKDKINQEMDEVVKDQLEDKKDISGIKTIIFSALYIEAAINDYGAWQLGDNYFNKHLGQLDVVSKWVIIPKLSCGKSLNKSGPAFSSLRKLIKSRNGLVHSKSRHLDVRNISEPSFIRKIEENIKSFNENVDNAYRTTVYLSLEMDKILGARYNPLLSFDKKINITFDPPNNLVDIINECKNTSARQAHNKCVKNGTC